MDDDNTIPSGLRKVTIRDFQREFYHEFRTLPLVITRYGKKMMVVLPYHPEYEAALSQHKIEDPLDSRVRLN